MSAISAAQLTKLQTLWGQYAAREVLNHASQCGSLPFGDPRALRLEWASKRLGRQITSFKECTKSEANILISALNAFLGLSTKSEGYSSTRAARARQRGREGRRNSGNALTLASTEDFERIQRATERLGWSQAQFDAWLRSPSSPLKRGNLSPTNPQIRTQADTNRVWWAMKRLLQRAGKWEDRPR
jgi:hypothetical protein